MTDTSLEEKVEHPFFALFYLRMASGRKAKGEDEYRRRLLEGLFGSVIEVGAGNGLNFAWYPETVVMEHGGPLLGTRSFTFDGGLLLAAVIIAIYLRRTLLPVVYLDVAAAALPLGGRLRADRRPHQRRALRAPERLLPGPCATPTPTRRRRTPPSPTRTAALRDATRHPHLPRGLAAAPPRAAPGRDGLARARPVRGRPLRGVFRPLRLARPGPGPGPGAQQAPSGPASAYSCSASPGGR